MLKSYMGLSAIGFEQFSLAVKFRKQAIMHRKHLNNIGFLRMDDPISEKDYFRNRE